MKPVRPATPPLLQVTGLRKAVPGGRVLFSDLDLDLAAGEFVAVMGESGVGKSTFLNLIAGLDTADAGQVRVEGVQVGTLDDDARTLLRRDRIGFVFQAFHVLPHLTLAQNVALPLALQRVPAAEALERAAAALAGVGLSGREADFPPSLSGGELQRVAIARALVHGPALILADEPTGNLDPETAGRILELFNAQARGHGAAVLLVTHSEVAAATADRVLRLTARGLAPRHGD
jgi:putative ABC transport system ATP-binding protein